VSKRNQTARRRSYGRRQHEVYEREARRLIPEAPELGADDFGPASNNDPLSFMDPRAPRLRFVLGE
jgi:hypothetical protein